MKSIITAATVAALTLTPALAVTSAQPAAPSVQAQIDALKQQVAALQQQMLHLKAAPKAQQVCISLWCA